MEKHFDNIEKLVKDSLILKVVAPSGYGKSTKLPNYLKVHYNLKVIVANNNIAKSLNFSNESNDSNKIYISSKDFLKNVNFPDLLIIDEMDTGSLENFIIISLWKASKTQTKLLLLSSLSHNLFPEFPSYQIDAKRKSDIRYINNADNLIDLVYQIHNSDVLGDFLIFTIKPYIQEIKEKLEKIIDADFYTSENIDTNMYKKEIKRKIVIATDLAKTSLTLDSISVIFDTMIERRLVPTITGGAKIRTEYISKRDADLRARNNSIVYRFITEGEYRNLPEFTEELIFRIPLHHLMLDIYGYNLNPFQILPKEYEGRMDFIYRLFLKYGIIDFKNKITKRGELLRKLSFGIRTSLLCLESQNYPTVILASCIENYRKYTIEPESENNFQVDYQINSLEHFKLYFERFRGFTDAETILNIFQSSEDESSLESLEQWCYENYIEYSYLRDIWASVEKVSKILNIGKENFNVVDFITSVEKLVEDLYYDKKLFLQPDSPNYTLYYDEKNEIYNIDPNSINLITIKQPYVIYGLILSSSHNSDGKYVSFTF